MCGLYGQVRVDQDIDPQECLQRTRALSHRGPDYCGHYANKGVFLGHARLSILDLTSAGNQPFGDNEAQLVFNGEIYNWNELRLQYLAEEHLSSISDTEVLFLLLGKMGTDCLPLLNGMFAFAYYSIVSNKLILARDSVGIKPIYFVSESSKFEFSSEIKNLSYIPDLGRLKEYQYLGRFGEDFSPYSNVNEVLPGSFVEIDCSTGQWHQNNYKEIENTISPEKYSKLSASKDLVDQLDALLQESVRLHAQSDAPIGYLCSGGLDSSLISAIAAKNGQNLSLYHADFEGEGRELHYAEQVAEHIGAPLRKINLTKEQFWQNFPEMTYASDLPIQHPHSISLNLISKKAKDDGVKVLIAGDGADELFLGYPFYSSYADSLSNYWSDNDPKVYLRKFQNFIRRASNPSSDPYWFFANVNRKFQRHAHVGFGGDATSMAWPFQSMSLVSQDFKAWKRWQQATEALDWMGESREANVLSFQLFYMRYFLQPLLHRLDRMLMNTSVEGRVPFLENEIIEFALNLPVDQKLNGKDSKYLLKQVALRYLPATVVNRKKRGFTVPFANYVTGYPQILDDGFVSDWTGLTSKQLKNWCNGEIDQIYRLTSIEVWGRIFVYKMPWADIMIDM